MEISFIYDDQELMRMESWKCMDRKSWKKPGNMLNNRQRYLIEVKQVHKIMVLLDKVISSGVLEKLHTYNIKKKNNHRDLLYFAVW